MWVYEKRLQCPVNIKETNAKLAQAIISQYGGLYTKANGFFILIIIICRFYFLWQTVNNSINHSKKLFPS